MKISEVERFWSHVVRGPQAEDCWIWVGAIGDDGYGRFWVNRDGKQSAVRPQRFAYQLETGHQLTTSVMLLHACDVPLCVHATADPECSHVTPGTNRINMLERSERGRFRNGSSTLSWYGSARKFRVQRSRDLRATILEHGWNRERISAALAGLDLDQPRLF